MRFYKDTPDVCIFASLAAFLGGVLFALIAITFDVKNHTFNTKLALVDFSSFAIGYLFAKMRKTK